MAEGGTALVPAPELAAWAGLNGELFIKDESRNPTWSHKDRFNLCSISVAVATGASGVVLASSGNHGASAAAYAARAGLPCIVLVSTDTPPAVQSFVQAYGAAVLAVLPAGSQTLIRQIVAPTLALFLSVVCLLAEGSDIRLKGSEPFIGTWELVSGATIQGKDTTTTDYTKNRKFLKIINASNFSFVGHDMNKGKDSLAFYTSGAGTYTLSDSNYTEHLQFCSDRRFAEISICGTC
jgi:hypothetical protein